LGHEKAGYGKGGALVMCENKGPKDWGKIHKPNWPLRIRFAREKGQWRPEVITAKKKTSDRPSGTTWPKKPKGVGNIKVVKGVRKGPEKKGAGKKRRGQNRNWTCYQAEKGTTPVDQKKLGHKKVEKVFAGTQ